MDIAKTARTLSLRLATLAGVLVVLTLFINLSWFDERLHGDITGLTSPEPVAMEGNAYPLLYGFLAAAERDPRAAGLAIIRTLRERHAAGQPATFDTAAMDEILGHPDPAEIWSDVFASIACNARFALDCADRLITEAAEIGVDEPRLRLLLERYGAILDAPRFHENQAFNATTPVPAYGALMSIARIRLAESYLGGSTAEFLAAIGADIAFWKRMLRDGQSLIAKMVALAGLRNDTQFLSQLLRERDLAARELAQLRAMASPLTAAERDIGETFLTELRIGLLSAPSLVDALTGPGLLFGLALQENATANEFYLTMTVPLRLRASLDARDYYLQRAYEPLDFQVRIMPPPLYNLGGKLLLKSTLTNIDWQDYITRVHDLDGRLALVRLQAEIEAEPERDVATIVRTSAIRNPYTLDPMDYDLEAGTIGFDCLATESDVCAIAIE